MKKIIIAAGALIFLCACLPGVTEGKSDDPKREYYRGVYNACIYSAVDRKATSPQNECDPFLKQAIEEDWYSAQWPAVPYNP